MLDDYVTILVGRPSGSFRRMQYYGLFSTTILPYDCSVLVVRSLGLRQDLLLAYLAFERPILNLDRILDDEYLLNLVA